MPHFLSAAVSLERSDTEILRVAEGSSCALRFGVAKVLRTMTDLKAILRDRGVRQKELAVFLGVSEATVSLWVAALRDGQNRRVPAESARKLADLLKIEPGRIRPDLWPLPAEAV